MEEEGKELVPTMTKLITANILLQQKEFTALLDTGAQSSLITLEVFMGLQEWTEDRLPFQQDFFKVQYANLAVSVGGLARLHLCWNEFNKEHTFIVMKHLSHPVILGMDILSIWPFLDRPAFTISHTKQLLAPYQLENIEEIVNSVDQEVVYHVDSQKLKELIEKELQDNLATLNIHSTIGEIDIEFLNKKDREVGVWRNQGPLSGAALEFYIEQVANWVKDNIVEEMSDLPKDTASLTGPFNVNAFVMGNYK